LLMVPVETARGEVVKIRGDSVEPVQLQVVCQTLWEKCQKSWGRLKDSDQKKIVSREYLEAFGDVDQALSAFYESAISRVVGSGLVKEGILRRWFEQSLITSAGTRGTVFRAKVDTAGIPNSAVDRLVNHHIIRAEIRSGSRWYELTHDRFIAPVKSSNEKWFREHSGGQQIPKQLEIRAQAWVDSGRQKKTLIADEGELLVAERWLDSPAPADLGYGGALLSSMLAFVQAGRAAKSEEKAQASEEKAKASEEKAKLAKRLKLVAVALAIMVVLMGVASLFAFLQRREALASQALAEQNRRDAEKREEEARKAKLDADAQRQLAEASTRRLEDLNAQVTDEKKRADQQTLLAQRNERIARGAKAQSDEYNKSLDKLSTQFKDADAEYEPLLQREAKDAKEKCALRQGLRDLRSKYLIVFAGYGTFGKVAEQNAVGQTIHQIENRLITLRDLECSP